MKVRNLTKLTALLKLSSIFTTSFVKEKKKKWKDTTGFFREFSFNSSLKFIDETERFINTYLWEYSSNDLFFIRHEFFISVCNFVFSANINKIINHT